MAQTIGVRKAAEILGLTVNQLYYSLELDQIPHEWFFKRGRIYRFYPTVLENLGHEALKQYILRISNGKME